MQSIIFCLLIQLLGASALWAENWDAVSLSLITNRSGDTVAKSVLTARSYIDLVAARDGTPTRDLFVGYSETSGEICVLRLSDKSKQYFIIYGLAAPATAANASNTKGSKAGSGTISTLSVACSGYVYDVFQRNNDGTFKSVKRTVIGGQTNQNITITGTARTAGKRYIF